MKLPYRMLMVQATMVAASTMAYAADLPDLVVENMVYQTTTQTLDVTYKNSGLGSGGSHQILVYANSKYWYSPYVMTPAPGQSAVVQVPAISLALTEGTSVPILAWADYYGQVLETNENNNYLSRTVNIGTVSAVRPDLSISSISYAAPYLVIKYRNVGTGGSDTRFAIMARKTEPAGGYTTYVTAATALAVPAPGTEASLSIYQTDLNLINGTAANIFATIDYYNAVNESQEANNNAGSTVAIGAVALPDLVVTDVTYDVASSSIVATVKNNGVSPTNASTYVRISANYYYFYGYLPMLAAGASTTISAPKSQFNLQEDRSYSINVQADYYGYVQESNESNNSLTKTVTVSSSAKSDLIVDNVEFDSLNNAVKVIVRNAGVGSSGGTQLVKVYANGYVGSISTSVPSPGTSVWALIGASVFNFTNGVTYSMQATADADFAIAESNEYNNSLTKQVLVSGGTQLPDLIISGISYDAAAQNVKVTYKNNGSGTSGALFRIMVYANNRSYFTPYGANHAVPAPGATGTLLVPRSALGIGDNQTTSVYAYVDYDLTVAEANENNNSSTIYVTTPAATAPSGQPDLTVTDILIRYGYIYVYYKNSGTALGSGSHKFRLASSSGQSYTTTAYAVPTMLNTTFVMTIHMSVLGLYSGVTSMLTATADADNAIAELDETNNSFSKTVTATYY